MSTPAPPSTSATRDAWDAITDGFDRLATPLTMQFGDQVLDRVEVGPGVRVLDVAAGSGALTIPAARRGADVVAVDIAPRMIERLQARCRADGLAVDARVGDGARLDLDDDSVDVAVSMNGVSLFPDLVGGLREMVRVTRPGGHVLVVTFGPLPQVEFIAFCLGAMRATLGDDVPAIPDPPPPFRLADPTTFRSTLAQAGLQDVRVDTATWDMRFESADHLLDLFLTSNPIAGMLASGMSDDQLAQVRHVVDGMLRERSGGSPGALLHAEMRIGRGAV